MNSVGYSLFERSKKKEEEYLNDRDLYVVLCL